MNGKHTETKEQIGMSTIYSRDSDRPKVKIKDGP